MADKDRDGATVGINVWIMFNWHGRPLAIRSAVDGRYTYDDMLRLIALVTFAGNVGTIVDFQVLPVMQES